MKPANLVSIGLMLLYCALSVSAQSPYLFVWAGDGDGKESDFLTVVDARKGQATYGQVLATVPVGAAKTYPHHTEYEFPSNSLLFANGWGAGKTFILDLRDPLKPKLSGQFKELGAYAFPHSYTRLPDGNLLGTFQVKKSGYEPPGGLLKLDSKGKLLLASSSDVAGMDKKQLWPYSVIALPGIDRVVTSSTEMGLPGWAVAHPKAGGHEAHTMTDTRYLQIWRLKDLKLLATIPLTSPDGRSHLNPAEPRVLRDGTVLVNTFNCGLFRLSGLTSREPTANFVYAFPGANSKEECGVPVVVGNYWIQTDPSLPGLVVVDVSEPAKPIEVSRLVLDKQFAKPHWVAADRAGNRLVVTGNNRSWVLLVDIDPATGKLTLDESFAEKGTRNLGINFDRSAWPHGSTGGAWVHGALFGPAISKR